MMPGREEVLHVGILCSEEILVEFEVPFKSEETGVLEGSVVARIIDGQVVMSQDGRELGRGSEFLCDVLKGNGSFRVKDVVIGLGFHWEQKEDQVFPGGLKLIPLGEKVQLINLVPVETYLESVISSEMRADSHPELLRAHAIISRSWVLAQIRKKQVLTASGEDYSPIRETEEEYIRWYDREDHAAFHVCADDHCQRYQGMSRASNSSVRKAVEETRGLVLWYKDELCDARFSKCCGGVVEAFQYCWEPVEHPYLQRVDDNPPQAESPVNALDLRIEENAEAFIKGNPPAFCNTSDLHLLAQVLNDYDKISRDFYRWEVRYSQEELADLLKRRSGMDFGEILDLQAVERGVSGRLVKLRIVGTRRSIVVGKELEIRRWLSESHLYSSAFVVVREKVHEGLPGSFFLRGSGWGHGVGLCQIGAAVMADRGYGYQEILKHYFVDSEIRSYEA